MRFLHVCRSFFLHGAVLCGTNDAQDPVEQEEGEKAAAPENLSPSPEALPEPVEEPSQKVTDSVSGSSFFISWDHGRGLSL